MLHIGVGYISRQVEAASCSRFYPLPFPFDSVCGRNLAGLQIAQNNAINIVFFWKETISAFCHGCGHTAPPRKEPSINADWECTWV